MKTAWLPLVSLLFFTNYSGAQDHQAPQPNTPAPTNAPPPPPDQPPVPPEQTDSQVVASAPEQQPAAQGQWVYTSQYGWVWLPYGAQYTYEPTVEGAYPYSYV